MSISNALGRALAACTGLLYPRLCLSCQQPVSGRQLPQLCVPCAANLPYTDAHRTAENLLTDNLLGRLPVQAALALLYYRTDTTTQDLIHALKYYHRPEIGHQLGYQLGVRVAAHPDLADLTGIVPVPIHPKRRHVRGYNQAEEIARGVREATGLPVYPAALVRTHFMGSQTRKTALERIENTRESFAAGPGDFTGHHLLLVDDVFTTGATIDFCGNTLLAAHAELRLSVGTLAVAGGL